MPLRIGLTAATLALVTLACISISAPVDLGGLHQATPTDFTLRSDDSTIWFTGFKNGGVAVGGSFSGRTGGSDAAGRRGSVQVPIATLATGDAERDKNLMTHLFAAGEHPLARFEIQNVTGATGLPAGGERVVVQVEGSLSLRGQTIPLVVSARLTRERSDRLRVASLGPMVLGSEQLGLSQAFAVLKAVCGHALLSSAVPLQFDLLFES